MKEFRMKNLVFRFIKLLTITFVFLFPVPYTLSPTYADVKIGDSFGFGGMTSLGQVTSTLMVPLFYFATFLVILYFLFGAFKYLTSGGNKETVAAARSVITQAIIGFFILMLAFLVLQFILSSLFGSEVVPFVNIFNK